MKCPDIGDLVCFTGAPEYSGFSSTGLVVGKRGIEVLIWHASKTIWRRRTSVGVISEGR